MKKIIGAIIGLIVGFILYGLLYQIICDDYYKAKFHYHHQALIGIFAPDLYCLFFLL
jgi:hypothetical protein